MDKWTYTSRHSPAYARKISNMQEF
jgi:hypothetical protein